MSSSDRPACRCSSFSLSALRTVLTWEAVAALLPRATIPREEATTTGEMRMFSVSPSFAMLWYRLNQNDSKDCLLVFPTTTKKHIYVKILRLIIVTVIHKFQTWRPDWRCYQPELWHGCSASCPLQRPRRPAGRELQRLSSTSCLSPKAAVAACESAAKEKVKLNIT